MHGSARFVLVIKFALEFGIILFSGLILFCPQASKQTTNSLNSNLFAAKALIYFVPPFVMSRGDAL